MRKAFFLLTFFCYQLVSYGQTIPAGQNWHWKDYAQDKVHGISLYQAYQKIIGLSKKNSPIIVAVMDGGIDTNHLDLKPLLWINKKEIAGNGIDDDQNGYIDDIHGWNFLGGKDGRNINKAADEKSRIYHKYKNVYEGKPINESSLSPIEKKQFELWKQAAVEIEFSEEDAANLSYLSMATNAIQKLGNTLLKELKDTNFTIEQLTAFQPIGRSTLDAKMAYLKMIKALGVEPATPYSELVLDLKEYVESKEKAASAKTNPPLDIRADIIKDNYENLADRFYGNNDITGPNPKHGTHVAGLVASKPDSNWKVNGWYPNIQIMGIRAVPDGDEYDKDIALGIQYAVDNGAKIINMSFGKSFSPEQIWVDKAIRYAASKDVLIIHSAGNEFYDLDTKSVYPNPYSSYLKDTANNLITVAASSDEFINNTVLTDFSNFGPSIVDVLSPGNKIYSTLPGKNNYGYLQGTSMAAPIVTHIAALIRSYFPELTAVEVKKIIMQSVWKPNDPLQEFEVPQKDITKKLSAIAAAGGIVNAANAISLASQFKTARQSKNKPATKK